MNVVYLRWPINGTLRNDFGTRVLLQDLLSCSRFKFRLNTELLLNGICFRAFPRHLSIESWMLIGIIDSEQEIDSEKSKHDHHRPGPQDAVAMGRSKHSAN